MIAVLRTTLAILQYQGATARHVFATITLIRMCPAVVMHPPENVFDACITPKDSTVNIVEKDGMVMLPGKTVKVD